MSELGYCSTLRTAAISTHIPNGSDAVRVDRAVPGQEQQSAGELPRDVAAPRLGRRQLQTELGQSCFSAHPGTLPRLPYPCVRLRSSGSQLPVALPKTMEVPMASAVPVTRSPGWMTPVSP